MLNLAQQYENTNRYARAGAVYYFLGKKEKARKSFKRDSYGLEALIKITPLPELRRLLDTEFNERRYDLQAGKIEWYLGNRERGQELIFQSGEFREVIERCKKLVQEGAYPLVIKLLWRQLRLPNYRHIIRALCKGSPACLKELDSYEPSKDVFPSWL